MTCGPRAHTSPASPTPAGASGEPMRISVSGTGTPTVPTRRCADRAVAPIVSPIVASVIP